MSILEGVRSIFEHLKIPPRDPAASFALRFRLHRAPVPWEGDADVRPARQTLDSQRDGRLRGRSGSLRPLSPRLTCTDVTETCLSFGSRAVPEPWPLQQVPQ